MPGQAWRGQKQLASGKVVMAPPREFSANYSALDLNVCDEAISFFLQILPLFVYITHGNRFAATGRISSALAGVWF